MPNLQALILIHIWRISTLQQDLNPILNPQFLLRLSLLMLTVGLPNLNSVTEISLKQVLLKL